MNFINNIVNLFKRNNKRLTHAEMMAEDEPEVEIAEEVQPIKHPLHTLYRIGPDVLTYTYSVDSEPLKEIYTKDGIIGPGKYSEETLQHIEKWDNEWFLDHPSDCELIEKDLLRLAKKYNKIGAYSLLGSIQINKMEQGKYWKYGAEMGNKEAMMAYACYLYTTGKLQEGFIWLKRSADMGETRAMFYTGISYNYGTLSEINLDKAAYYYIKAIKSEEHFFAYINLAVLLADSGYYHTALKYHEIAKQIVKKNDEEWREYGHLDEYLCNEKTLLELLELPYPQRAKRMVLQGHSRRLLHIFLLNNKPQPPVTSELSTENISKWIPKADDIELDIRDIAERNAVIPFESTKPVDVFEDFVFVSIPVDVTSPAIAGIQHEIIFLEKNCHLELNKFIQDHLVMLKAAFKSIGYSLTYLPSHVDDLEDQADLIGSYYQDYGREGFHKSLKYNDRTEADYWGAMIPSQKLPVDCAGFLRYVPLTEEPYNHHHFEYILFPLRPGTDWARAFGSFLDDLRRKPFVETSHAILQQKQNILPRGSLLVITPQGGINVVDNAGEILMSVQMPVLSKVMFLLLLNHPEGVAIKSLIDYKDELFGYYQKIAKEKANTKNIETLVDPTNNSANEKISRIKSAFRTAFNGKYEDDLNLFLPTGKRGEAYTIKFDRGRVRLEL